METLDCETARRLIHLRLDGELTSEDAQLLAEHLSHCPECSERARQLSGIDDALRSGLAARESPDDLRERTHRRVARVRAVRGVWTTWLPAAAALLLAGTLAWVVTSAEQGPSPAPAVVLSGGDAVHVFAPDQRVARPGETGAPLQERAVAWALGEISTTLQFSTHARVELSDEAVVRIGHGSLDLFKGRLRADLTHSEEPFTVTTAWGEVTGAGGVFSVHADADGKVATLTVLAGEVTLRSRDSERTLSAGESATMQLDPERMFTL